MNRDIEIAEGVFLTPPCKENHGECMVTANSIRMVLTSTRVRINHYKKDLPSSRKDKFNYFTLEGHNQSTFWSIGISRGAAKTLFALGFATTFDAKREMEYFS